MEVSAIRHLGAAGAHGRSPLLRLQSDERLVGLVRRGNHHAFEALVSRYQSRLLAFCRHMLSSREDAEDVLQEVFAAAFNAMLADERPINVRPWLYRIARNRCLNHLRRTQAVGVDSMDIHFAEHGLTTAEKAHRREDFRLLIADVQELPESQRTALLLREIDALSYEQIAEAMENTVPSVKSLLVRARVGLAEAAEARLLDCDVVRFELGEVAEGLKRMSTPVRRHVRTCGQCALFRRQLADTNRQLAALLPVGPLLILKKTLFAQLGTAAAASSGPAMAGSAAGGALQLTLNAAAGKAAAGLAAAAIVTAGAVEAKHVAIDGGGRAAVVVTGSTPSVAAPPASASAVPQAPARERLALVAPGLDPFAPTIDPAPAAAEGRPDAPIEVVVTPPSEQPAGAAPEVGAAVDVARTGESGATAPPVTTAAPVLVKAPTDGAVKPLGTPLVTAPIQPAVVVEGVVRPADAALGTPVTGIVNPGGADKQPPPLVESVTPVGIVAPALEVTPAPIPGEPVADTEEEAATTPEPVAAPDAASAIAEILPAPAPDPAPAPADVPQVVQPAAVVLETDAARPAGATPPVEEPTAAPGA